MAMTTGKRAGRPASRPAALVLALLLAGCGPAGGAAGDVDRGALRQTTEHLAGVIGPRECGGDKEREAADYLTERLRELGYSEEAGDLERTAFEHPGGRSENIIVRPSRRRDGPILTVVAHYDSVAGSPGARDNAGAVAGLLEMARLLRQAPPSYETCLVFLGAEENGYHGSAAYVEGLEPAEIIRHAAAFNMDISVASPDAGAVLTCNTLGMNSGNNYFPGNALEPADNLASRGVAAAFRELTGATEADNGTRYRSPRHYGESDHVSFHHAAIDAVNVCWRRPNGDYSELPAQYHSPEDTASGLDYSTLELTIRCILRAMDLAADGRLAAR